MKNLLQSKNGLRECPQEYEWGDALCLLLMTSWWSCRIGVRSGCLELITYRNKEGIDDQEVLMLFNCSPVVGHYSAILRFHASVMAVSKVNKSAGYVWEVNSKERRNRGTSMKGEGEDTHFVLISRHTFCIDFQGQIHGVVGN